MRCTLFHFWFCVADEGFDANSCQESKSWWILFKTKSLLNFFFQIYLFMVKSQNALDFKGKMVIL